MEVEASLDLPDRILALQAVRMFSRVDVADLEQIANALVEQRYEPNERIFSRGDWGEDMILVVAGSVQLVGDVPLPPRGPGEHIGELAVLRHQSRSLTATAGPEGMRGLSMDCRVLERLMENRPQIATSMLGTLADILAQAESTAPG